MTGGQPIGPLHEVEVRGQLDVDSRIEVSQPAATDVTFLLQLGASPAAVTLAGDRAALVRLSDAIDAAVAEFDEREVGDPEM